MKHLVLSFLMLVGLILPALAAPPETVRIGSKAFAESWILGDALCMLARDAGAQVEYRKGLGATVIIYEALRSGSIDVYPEYLGTIKQVFLKGHDHPSDADVLSLLAADGIGVSYSLGFTNSYALAVPKTLEGVETISDLARHPELRIAVNNEFMGRKDGWPGLAQAYGLKSDKVSEMQHELCYKAISSGKVEVIDVYTTDAQIEELGLKLLRDDKNFFPRYDAVLLYRADLPARSPKAWAALLQLVGRISEKQMSRANAKHFVDKLETTAVAQDLLKQCLPQRVVEANPKGEQKRGWDWNAVGTNVARHLQLVGMSLCVAILIGIPLGVLASQSRLLASITLSGTALLQTIPSLALLAFLVPLLGVGIKSALVALFVYSLLPIVRNTYTGLTTIPGNLAEAAEAIGLTRTAQLLWVRLPMASPSILAGIKTSAVINVGTATLAALVGAGGLGQSILQGISLLDDTMILQGAIPAAALALFVQGLFDVIERLLVPRGLRL